VGLRLKKAPEGATGSSVETGLRRYETPFIKLDAWHTNEDGSLSWTGGAYASPDTRYGDGTRGDEYSLGRCHRGVELSLTGELTRNLSMAAGLMAFEPRMSAAARTSGQVSSRPIGVQRLAAQVTADYTLMSIRGLSFDTQVNHAGDRLARSDGSLRTPARTTIDVGARYRFEIGRAPAVLRMRIHNVTDVHDWIVDSSGLLSREQARTYMLSLGFTIDRDSAL